MGCDIHLHVEIKLKNINDWQHYSNPIVERNYPLFAKMANVRNYSEYTIDPISEPKGLPNDCSIVTKVDYNRWQYDAHSSSWLDSKEIFELFTWLGKYYDLKPLLFFSRSFGYLFGNTFDGFTKYKDSNPEELEDVRFVFWFDN